MPELAVRPFRRADRDQLTALVNAHVRAVVPGVSVSVNAMLSALEREPAEYVVDPWVVSRATVVAERDARVVAAAQLHRYGTSAEVGEHHRGAAELRWLVCRPEDSEAGGAVIDAAVGLAHAEGARAIHAGGGLPAPGCHGVPDVWPHVAHVLRRRGFAPSRTETLHLSAIPLPSTRPSSTLQPGDGPVLRRSVGRCGTRLSAHEGDEVLGYVEVDVPGDDGARHTRAGALADLADLEVRPDHRRRGVGSTLVRAAAEWARLGGAERLLAYSEPDEHALVALLERTGFSPLAQIACGWTMRP